MAYPNLSAELKRYGFTQDQMAAKIGRTPETVSNWMLGKTSPTVSDAFKIRDELFPMMSVEYLFAAEPQDG